MSIALWSTVAISIESSVTECTMRYRRDDQFTRLRLAYVRERTTRAGERRELFRRLHDAVDCTIGVFRIGEEEVGMYLDQASTGFR